jgi:fructose/tagatose bisphosphate aldolase
MGNMLYQSVEDMKSSLGGILAVQDGKLEILDDSALRETAIDQLVYNAVHGGSPEIKGTARWIIKTAAGRLGAKPASIQSLYEGMGRRTYEGFTVPAINVRGMTYDVARAIFRAALKNETGALIFEIARSEIGYTKQRPGEYIAVILGAAVKEGFDGPVFIQGDHFQINAKKFGDDPDAEVAGLKDLIKEALTAGFFNIDIDTSTLVDLDKPNLTEQQRLNFELAADFTKLIRELEPEGVTVSVGGEIGEVGKKNSTVEEMRAFMDGYNQRLREISPGSAGLSKMSVQTGTSHGGVVLPDGSIAQVKIDFDTLKDISAAAKDEYGMSGAVQHGASTLPDEFFHRFPETQTSEIHLATGFQNMIYEHETLPEELKNKVYSHLKEACASEWKEGQTEEQFIYKTRKKGFGPFKKEFADLSEDTRAGISLELEKKFDFLFNQLKVVGTKDIVTAAVKPVDVPFKLEDEIKAAEKYG